METILNILNSVGVDLVALLAAMIVSGVVGYLLPLIRTATHEMILRIQGSPSKADDIAVPILEALEAGLGGVSADNPELRTVAQLLARSIVDSARNPAEAKVAAGRLGRQLGAEVARKIRETAS